MKMLAAILAIVLLLSAGWASRQAFTEPGTLILGGNYVIHRGEVLRGDLSALFAQVTLEEGARLEGNIALFSSALDLAGSVSGDILAVGSDTRVRGTARLLEAPREVRLMPFVILLPQMARMGEAGAKR